MSTPPAATERRPIRFDPSYAMAGLLGLGMLWAYWPTLMAMIKRWSTDPRYAHGYLVPAFALALLWIRRDRLATLTVRPNWGGLLLVGLGLACWLAGAYFYVDWFEALALLPALAGLCVLVWGWPSLRLSWPAIAFLIFMIPLPFRVEGALASPLQRVATKASTYGLQTLGFPALAEGNVIQMEDSKIGVVEACSGLSMLFTFIAMSVGVALVIRRPWPDKLAIVASAVPIALIVNVLRITVTGVLHETAGDRLAHIVYHDLAGWLMMPLALGLLWVELELLARLFVEPDGKVAVPSPVAVASGRSPRRAESPEVAALKRALRNP